MIMMIARQDQKHNLFTFIVHSEGKITKTIPNYSFKEGFGMEQYILPIINYHGYSTRGTYHCELCKCSSVTR